MRGTAEDGDEHDRERRRHRPPDHGKSVRLDGVGCDPESLEGLARGFLLGGLLRRAPPDAELGPGDVGRADEAAVVRRSLDLEHGVVHLAAGAGERLLELRLVVDVARAGELDLLAERRDDRRLDTLESVLEVESGDGRLEQRGEHVPAAGDALELVARDVPRPLGEPLAEAELLGHESAGGAGDDVRPDLREPALRGVLEAVEDRAGDGELEDAVPEELEPLVGLGAVVRPGGVLEDLFEPRGRELPDQPAELLRRLGPRAGVR